MQMQLVIEVAEKHLSQMVAFGDDDSIFVAQITERGKSGSKHRVRAHEGMTAGGIKFRQPGFHRCDIGYDARGRQERHHLSESLDGVFHRHGINHHFGLKCFNFIHGGETERIKSEAQALFIGIKDCHLVVHTQHIAEERTHFSCT